VMVGPDEVDWQSELRAQASRLGIADRVHWTGTLRGAAKWGAFYGAEAFILPSHQENFGIAVADALACGTISLISDKVNIARDVEGDGAAIVDSDTPEGTVRLIEQFLALSEADRQAMQRKARTCYEKRYALKNAAEEVYSALGIGLSNSRSSDSDTAVPIAN
jgi:glycosyltransferase involved in cell wall biosynthesis